MKIKVITYNTLTGFVDKNKKGIQVINKKRQKAAQKLIKEENPDILILTEANFVKSNSRIKRDYKKIFGYKYEIFGSDIYKDMDWGVSILSKYPIIESYDYTTKHSRWVRAMIKIKNKTMMVDGVHPDPYHNEYQRMQWFKTVIRDRKNPYILAGDFNAFSPEDKYDKKKLIKGFTESLGDKWKYQAKEIVNSILKGDTIRFLLKEGLIDTFKKKHKRWDYSYHTKLSGNKYDYSRIEYIFCSKDLKLIDSGMIKNNLSEMASDHYPIFAILNI